MEHEMETVFIQWLVRIEISKVWESLFWRGGWRGWIPKTWIITHLGVSGGLLALHRNKALRCKTIAM